MRGFRFILQSVTANKANRIEREKKRAIQCARLSVRTEKGRQIEIERIAMHSTRIWYALQWHVTTTGSFFFLFLYQNSSGICVALLFTIFHGCCYFEHIFFFHCAGIIISIFISFFCLCCCYWCYWYRQEKLRNNKMLSMYASIIFCRLLLEFHYNTILMKRTHILSAMYFSFRLWI